MMINVTCACMNSNKSCKKQLKLCHWSVYAAVCWKECGLTVNACACVVLDSGAHMGAVSLNLARILSNFSIPFPTFLPIISSLAIEKVAKG